MADVNWILGVTHTQGAALSAILSGLSLLIHAQNLTNNCSATVRIHSTPLHDGRITGGEHALFTQESWNALHRATGLNVEAAGPSAEALAAVEVCTDLNVVERFKSRSGRCPFQMIRAGAAGGPGSAQALLQGRGLDCPAKLPPGPILTASHASAGDEERARYILSIAPYLAALASNSYKRGEALSVYLDVHTQFTGVCTICHVQAPPCALSTSLAPWGPCAGTRLINAALLPPLRPALALLIRTLELRPPLPLTASHAAPVPSTAASADASVTSEVSARALERCAYFYEQSARNGQFDCPSGGLKACTGGQKYAMLVQLTAAAGLDCLVVNQLQPLPLVTERRVVTDPGSGREVRMHPAEKKHLGNAAQLYFASRVSEATVVAALAAALAARRPQAARAGS